MAQIWSWGITQMFGEPHLNDLQFALTDGFPVTSHSVVQVLGSSGKLMTYDEPAPHPLQWASLQLHEEWESDKYDEPEDRIEWWPLYRARFMNLSSETLVILWGGLDKTSLKCLLLGSSLAKPFPLKGTFPNTNLSPKYMHWSPITVQKNYGVA